MKNYLSIIVVFVLLFSGCKKIEEIEKMLWKGVFKSTSQLSIELTDDDKAKVLSFGNSGFGTNNQVFQVGSSFIKGIVRTGPNSWSGNVAQGTYDGNGKLTAVNYVPTEITMQGDKLVIKNLTGVDYDFLESEVASEIKCSDWDAKLRSKSVWNVTSAIGVNGKEYMGTDFRNFTFRFTNSYTFQINREWYKTPSWGDPGTWNSSSQAGTWKMETFSSSYGNCRVLLTTSSGGVVGVMLWPVTIENNRIIIHSPDHKLTLE
jgi:hypothetical protein